ncbi:hypothetical protein [Pelagimonas sp.]|uniref:hypothetical protein n=1 Tax=Pelagimonas sp. TaxID=2073170 RepID=UPI003D6A5AE5
MAHGQKWDDENCQPFVNEYDRYLLHAAGQLRRGASQEDTANYLMDIEANHMGLGHRQDAAARAKAVIAAIQADQELWTYQN